jgi:hypothetical protein
MCGDCGDDMALEPDAVLENAKTEQTAAAASRFDSVNCVDWELLYRQKRTLVECMISKQVTPDRHEHLSGILDVLDALLDDAEAAGCWTHPLAMEWE